jgi:hypothetical protein
MQLVHKGQYILVDLYIFECWIFVSNTSYSDSNNVGNLGMKYIGQLPNVTHVNLSTFVFII